MSALGAIETPVATAPEPRTAVGQDVARDRRALRAVGSQGHPVVAQGRDDAIGDRQPRSSSILVAGSQRQAAPAAGPRLAPGASAGLAPAVARPAPRPASATAPRVIRATLVVPGPRAGTARPRVRTTPALGAGVSPTRLRLTRRGQIVVSALVLAVVIVAVLLITLLASGGAQATSHGRSRAGYQGMHQVVVQPGQTLWSIAAAAEPASDPRTVVQEIMLANALGSPAISAGQQLWVP